MQYTHIHVLYKYLHEIENVHLVRGKFVIPIAAQLVLNVQKCNCYTL